VFDIGFWELSLIIIVALVVVGPERLPKLIRVTGLWLGRASASLQSIRSEISNELRAEELKQALNKTVDVDLPDLNETISLDETQSKDKDGNG
jgi:sec-independent protein translocase protein TatB